MSLLLFYFNHTDHSVTPDDGDNGIEPKSSNNKYYGLLWFFGEPHVEPPPGFTGWTSIGFPITTWIVIGFLSTIWTAVTQPTTHWTEE